MHRRLLRTVTLVAALALALAACPADDPVVDGPDEDPAVTISGNSFVPNQLEVEAGTTITVVNEDAVGHTVTAGTPEEPTGEFDESLPSQGDSAEITLGQEGTFPYFCQVHPAMRGELRVSG